MTSAPSDTRHAHCHNCREVVPVRTRLMGGKTLMRCIPCGNWIHCDACRGIAAIDHDCPMVIIEVPA